MADGQIIVPDITADTNLDELIIKDGDKILIHGTDYTISKVQGGKNVTVTIAFKGNYTGTIIKSYTVKDKKEVPTGDMSSVGLWSTILVFSTGLTVFLKRKKYKEQIEE